MQKIFEKTDIYIYVCADNQQELHAVLDRAVHACPQSVTLWLMNAKEHWLAGNVPAARAVLEAAHNSIPESEEIVLAAFKLEFENGEADRARVIAIRAKDSLPHPSARVWMKAAVASRELGNEQVRRASVCCIALLAVTLAVLCLPVARLISLHRPCLCTESFETG